MKKDPKVPAEWQEAVDLANAMLHLDSARKFGLVTGGPVVDVKRCEDIIEKAALIDIYPTPGSVEKIIVATVGS